MARNFYVVLGVSRDADLSLIRRAHRRLARLHHPDTGTGSLERFTEIQQAYETLTDEDAKRAYDESLPPEPGSLPVARARRAPRSKRAQHPATRPMKKISPVRIKDAAGGMFDVIDEFLDGWLPGFFTTGRTASRRKDLYVEIVLEPDEAARGGLFPLAIPVREQCHACGATGYFGMFLCRVCRGTGITSGRREVEISMPARVSDGTEARLSLEDIGLKGVDLNVLVSVKQ